MTWVTALREMHDNRIGMAIGELHRAENSVYSALLQLSDSQKSEHEIFHVARDISCWSREHVRGLARAGEVYGVHLDPDPDEPTGLLERALQRGSEALGRRPEPGLLLLAGLRQVHRLAAGASLDWEILAQTAQAVRDTSLLELAEDCHPQTLRQVRWANAKLKESSPQIILGG